MNIVICTGIGLAGVVLLTALFVGILRLLIQLMVRFQGKFKAPDWLNYLGGTLLVAFAAGALLVASHDLGCYVIHLTMRH